VPCRPTIALTSIGPSIIAARALTTSNFRRLSNTVEAGMLVGTMVAIERALTSPAVSTLPTFFSRARCRGWLQERVSVTNFARLASAPRSLGEFAVPARDLDQIISVPWREVGRRVTGSPDTPLHANAFGGFATRENIRRSQGFFRMQPIASRAAERLGMRGLAIEWGAAASVGAAARFAGPGASRSCERLIPL
jgi:hypothetical protein